MRGIGEVTDPALCDLTQMTLMQVLHTGSNLNRWEPLRKTLYTESCHLVYCVPGDIWGKLDFSGNGVIGEFGYRGVGIYISEKQGRFNFGSVLFLKCTAKDILLLV